MNDRVQSIEGTRLVKHHHPQPASLDIFILIENRTTKCCHDRLVTRPTFLKQLMTQFISLQQMAAQANQLCPYSGLAGRHSPRQSDLQHYLCRPSAACTVFDINMAIVRGPTPPGTGV